MAKTLLNGVNEVLKRTGMIQGDATALTSLTDTARQVGINIAVQVWNEALEDLYSYAKMPFPNEQAESTITLVTGTRSYSLASDLNQLRFPFIDKTNNQYIWEYEGGYNGLLRLDPEQDDAGTPHWGAISPVNGNIHLDVQASSDVNGNVYTYQYDKDMSLSSASDTFPFKDVVFRALVPSVSQLWERERKRSFDEDIYQRGLGVAATYLTQVQRRTSWNPRG